MRLRVIETGRVLTWQRIVAQFPKKGCCQSSLTQMNANIRWSWPKQISFSTKTANALQRSFSVNLFRTLRLSTVLSPIWKNLYRFCEFCICSLNALYTNIITSSWHQIYNTLQKKDKFKFKFSHQQSTFSEQFKMEINPTFSQ